ncbi:MAG TPA: GAF domain-containing protein [Brevibacterium sp.]|nr:GAF domain-containing protein [Brevibacterium sp.]
MHPSLRFTDPTAYARRTVAAHDAVFSATTVPCASAARRAPGLHPQMLAGWRRSGEAGVRPDQEMPRRVLTDDDLRLARERTPLSRVAGEVVRAVADTSAGGRHLVVLTDADGVVLWRAGSAQAMRGADRIAFAEGADWSEAGIGTNGISRALETGGMTHVTAGEHFVRAHHAWTCSAAPIRGADGSVVGVLDVSLPVRFATAESAALVRCGVRLAEALLPAGPARAGAEIRLLGHRPEVVGADGHRVPLTRRRAELLALLASREAWTARGLAEALYDDPTATATVRGEIRRLRRTTGLTIAAQPYALTEDQRERVDFLTAGDALDLLPDSDVPAIVDLRYTA